MHIKFYTLNLCNNNYYSLSYSCRSLWDFSANTASPKQWEGIGFQLTPGRGTYAGVLVSYDLINQKYRSLANITTFNNSSKPTIELVDYIFDYEKVRIEMDGIMIFMYC